MRHHLRSGPRLRLGVHAVAATRDRHRNVHVLASALLLLVAATPALAQFTFPVGGGAATSASFSAEATVGGMTIGNAAGTTFFGDVGFFATLPANAPFGVLPPFAVAADADATITALLQDDISVVSATLNYRPGGITNFTAVPMTLTDAGTGEWSATIPANDLSVRGVQYYVDASDGVNVASVPPAAPVASIANLTVNISGHPAFTLDPGVYELAGAPLRPSGTSAEAVFDELGPFDPKVWRYGTFNSATGAYSESGSAAPVVPGQGFWVISRDGASIAVNGTTTSLAGDFVVTLEAGFNQIANPFAFNVAFASIALPTGVDANLIGWNGTSYDNGLATLRPGGGYWIFNGSGANVDLAIPSSAAAASRAPIAPVAPGQLDRSTKGEDASWSVTVTAHAGGYGDRDNRFGMRAGATSARDTFDFMDAPQPPGGFAVVSLLSDEVALLTDYREPNEDGATWTVQFRSDQAGQPYRIDFAAESDLPEGWKLVAISENGMITTDLGAEGVLLGHVGSTALSRTWTVTAGLPEYVEDVQEEVQRVVDRGVTEFAFSRPFPNPARALSGTSFEFRVPQTSQARIEVFDVTGRSVTTLLDGPVSRGAHRIQWNATDRAGRRVAAGMYFVRVHTDGFSRREKVVLLK